MARFTASENLKRSWVYGPARTPGRFPGIANRFKSRTIPGIVGGLALRMFGRRLRGRAGRAVSALGTSMALGAAGRSMFRRFA